MYLHIITHSLEGLAKEVQAIIAAAGTTNCSSSIKCLPVEVAALG